MKSKIIITAMLIIMVITVTYLNFTKNQDHTPAKPNAAEIIDQLTTDKSIDNPEPDIEGIIDAMTTDQPATIEYESKTAESDTEAEDYWVYYLPDTKEIVSAAVFTQDEAFFCLSLTKGRLNEIQSVFQRDMMLVAQDIGLVDSPYWYPDLTFRVDRGYLREIISVIEQDDEINGILLIKNIPQENTEYVDKIPAGQYRVEAFFNANTVDQIYQDFVTTQNGTGCYLYQRADIEGEIMGTYFIDAEQIMLMHDLFQSNPDAKCVNFGTWLRVLTSDEISL